MSRSRLPAPVRGPDPHLRGHKVWPPFVAGIAIAGDVAMRRWLHFAKQCSARLVVSDFSRHMIHRR